MKQKKNYLYILINFRIKEIYVQLGEYEKAFGFNKSFSESFLLYLKNNDFDKDNIPYIVNEGIPQIKTNGKFDVYFYEYFKSISKDLLQEINFYPPAVYFTVNGRDIVIGYMEINFLDLFIKYLQEVCTIIEIDEINTYILKLSDLVIDGVLSFYSEELHLIAIKYCNLVSVFEFQLNSDNKYLLSLIKCYTELECLQFGECKPVMV